MTKLEMINEMLENINEKQKEDFTKRAMKKSKKIIERCYNFYQNEHEKNVYIFLIA